MIHVRLLGMVVGLAVALPWAQAEERVADLGLDSERSGQGWSVLSGRTVGASEKALLVQAGWPGISATFLYGLLPRLDVGARLTFNYGYEGLVAAGAPGLKLQGVIRFNLLETERFNLGLEAAPGPLFYFRSGFYTESGIAFPVGLTGGLAVGSALLLNFSLTAPMFATFGYLGALTVPVLVGAGAEYFLSDRFTATVQVRMGPSIHTPTGRADFAFETLVGAALRL